MARSLNDVTLLGNLGADPDVRATSNGSQVASFSVATSTSYKVNNEWKEKTQWHRVVAWQNEKGPQLVDIAAKMRKGDCVLIKGMIEYRTWLDKENVTRHTTEIKASVVVPLSTRDDTARAATPAQRPATSTNFAEPPMDFDVDEPPY